MKFLCGGCRTKYQIADEKIRGKILTIRCKKCGAKILVRESLTKDGGTAVAPIAEEDRAAALADKSEARSAVQGGAAVLASAFDVAMRGEADGEDMPTCIAPTPQNLEAAGLEWYVAIDGEQSGPFAFAEVVRRVQAKEVLGRHYVWHDGMDGWKRVREVGDLVAYLEPKERKRPPPPPAEGRGADVVDFASKRKEREQQKKTTADLTTGDVEREVVPGPAQEAEGPTEAKVEAKAPPSAREEQLDHVLNQALGIQGEDATQRASAERAGVVAMAGVAPAGEEGVKPTVDDLLSFDKDDIFANVPRASQADLVRKEATRFFVAAAGVNRQRSRNKIGFALGIAATVLFASFMVAWYMGAIRIYLPGIGNPFEREEKVEDEELARAQASGDADEVRRILEGRDKAKAAGTRRKKPRTNGAGAANLPDEYVDDEGTEGSSGSRTGEAERLAIDAPGSDPGAVPTEVVQAELPKTGIENVPLPDSKVLTEGQIAQVVNERKRSVQDCYAKSLRGKEDLRGKLVFEVTIDPSGAVSKVNIGTTQFKGTEIARCIQLRIKEWRFPAFQGEPQVAEIPFHLEKGS